VRKDLFIPVRDRRARKRYLTLKNAGIAAAVVVVIIAGITIHASMQRTKPGQYGRLLGHQVSQPEPAVTRPVDIVTEDVPIADQPSADPLLVEPAAREQMLGVNQTPPAPVPLAAPAPVAAPAAAMPGAESDGQHVAIVGDGSGVAIVRSKGDATPKLHGGFGRQQ
jgi:hypothetical protein